VQPHHRFLLKRILAHIDFLEESVEEVQQEIEERLAPSARSGRAGLNKASKLKRLTQRPVE
jgi:hypothetical protein